MSTRYKGPWEADVVQTRQPGFGYSAKDRTFRTPVYGPGGELVAVAYGLTAESPRGAHPPSLPL